MERRRYYEWIGPLTEAQNQKEMALEAKEWARIEATYQSNLRAQRRDARAEVNAHYWSAESKGCLPEGKKERRKEKMMISLRKTWPSLRKNRRIAPSIWPTFSICPAMMRSEKRWRYSISLSLLIQKPIVILSPCLWRRISWKPRKTVPSFALTLTLSAMTPMITTATSSDYCPLYDLYKIKFFLNLVENAKTILMLKLPPNLWKK